MNCKMISLMNLVVLGTVCSFSTAIAMHHEEEQPGAVYAGSSSAALYEVPSSPPKSRVSRTRIIQFFQTQFPESTPNSRAIVRQLLQSLQEQGGVTFDGALSRYNARLFGIQANNGSFDTGRNDALQLFESLGDKERLQVARHFVRGLKSLNLGIDVSFAMEGVSSPISLSSPAPSGITASADICTPQRVEKPAEEPVAAPVEVEQEPVTAPTEPALLMEETSAATTTSGDVAIEPVEDVAPVVPAPTVIDYPPVTESQFLESVQVIIDGIMPHIPTLDFTARPNLEKHKARTEIEKLSERVVPYARYENALGGLLESILEQKPHIWQENLTSLAPLMNNMRRFMTAKSPQRNFASLQSFRIAAEMAGETLTASPTAAATSAAAASSSM